MFRHARLLAIACLACGLLSPSAANATSLWYNGDFNGVNGLRNGLNFTGGSVNDSTTYDDFVVSDLAGWTIQSVFSNDLTNNTGITSASWSIRTGVSSGNAGTVVASGSGAATQTLKSAGGFGRTEYTITVSGLNIFLTPGTYWLQVTPIDSGSFDSFNSTTSGLNAVGTPPGNDGNSFITFPLNLLNFAPGSTQNSGVTTDFSMGINGVIGGGSTVVPEPMSLLLLGSGLIGAGVRRYRRKEW